jgi:predicted acyltransferase
MNSTTIAQPNLPGKSARLISLDVMRGITIAFMILVNDSGDEQHSYSQLKHATWNGWTATDLIFPTFLFLVGVSVVFSFESRLARGASKRALFFHTLRRSAVLFLLGLVVNGFPYFHWDTLRIYGVLQRIAICFFLASALYLWDRRVSSKVAMVAIALIGYWILLRWVPVPGFGMPGRDIPLFDPRANLTAYIDRHIFPGRLYNDIRDPEGLLSNLPALGTTLLGVLTGIWLRSKRSASQTAFWMMVAGIGGIGLGLVWNQWFPINKNLWTSSYVLLAAGCSLIGLTICYWAIEIQQWKRGWTYPWLAFGTNAITAYVLSELLSAALGAIRVNTGAGGRLTLERYIFLRVFVPVHDLALASLLYAICFVLVCFVPIAILYQKKIIIKV